MNIQIYAHKKNFDVQKAERFFKERGIRAQSIDLAKHMPGAREIALFLSVVGREQLIDPKGGPMAQYALQMSNTEALVELLLQNPQLLQTPIVRNGRQITVGFAPKVWEQWT